MRTAKLYATTVNILCPCCQTLQRAEDGTTDFRQEDLTGGDVRVCQNPTCRDNFRLPTTLRAEVTAPPKREAEGASTQ